MQSGPRVGMGTFIWDMPGGFRRSPLPHERHTAGFLKSWQGRGSVLQSPPSTTGLFLLSFFLQTGSGLVSPAYHSPKEQGW